MIIMEFLLRILIATASTFANGAVAYCAWKWIAVPAGAMPFNFVPMVALLSIADLLFYSPKDGGIFMAIAFPVVALVMTIIWTLII
jgi:hypothetical protein